MDTFVEETLLPISPVDIRELNYKCPSKNNEIAIVFDNFLRDALMFNLVKSIFTYCPGVKIYIADQSVFNISTVDFYDKLREAGHEVIFCGFDAGISVSRNSAISRVKEPFIFVCDCDNLFSHKLDLFDMKNILIKNREIGFLGQYELMGDILHYYNINFEISDRTLVYNYIDKNDKIRDNDWFYCDCTMNAGLAKKELFDTVRYEESMKLAEHIDFFLQIKKLPNWRVACSTKNVISNQDYKINNEQYKTFRNRNNYYFKMYAEKWDLVYINDYELLTGKTTVSKKIIKEQQPPKTEKTEENIDVLPFLKMLAKEIEFWLLGRTCLEKIKYHKLLSNKLYFGVQNEQIKEKLHEKLSPIARLFTWEIIVEPSRRIKNYNGLKVPLPVVQYLSNLYGDNWSKNE